MAAGFVFYPAEAGGTGHCPASRSNLWRPGSCSIRRKQVEPGTARPAALIYGGRVRVLSGGSGWNRALPGQRKQPGAGSACSVRSGSLMCCAVLHAMQQRLQPPKGPGELATHVLWLRCLTPAEASGTGHCPALTLSNAVPWFSSEVDTSLSSQFLVVGMKRGSSN